MSFSHDGLRDSLTHLAAPPYFYENLRREISMAHRNRSRLLLIRFQLTPHKPLEASIYEAEILAFAEIVRATTRPEDLCARLGIYEFTMILRADQQIGKTLAQRVMGNWHSDLFTCMSALIEVNAGESSLEILNRLDNQELLPYSPS